MPTEKTESQPYSEMWEGYSNPNTGVEIPSTSGNLVYKLNLPPLELMGTRQQEQVPLAIFDQQPEPQLFHQDPNQYQGDKYQAPSDAPQGFVSEETLEAASDLLYFANTYRSNPLPQLGSVDNDFDPVIVLNTTIINTYNYHPVGSASEAEEHEGDNDIEVKKQKDMITGEKLKKSRKNSALNGFKIRFREKNHRDPLKHEKDAWSSNYDKNYEKKRKNSDSEQLKSSRKSRSLYQFKIRFWKKNHRDLLKHEKDAWSSNYDEKYEKKLQKQNRKACTEES